MLPQPHFLVLMSSSSDHSLLLSTAWFLSQQIYSDWTIALDETLPADIKSKAQKILGSHIVWEGDGGIAVGDQYASHYVLPLLPGDIVSETALAEIALNIRSNPEAKVIYTDHLQETDRETVPHFKPSISPEYLLVTDYIQRAAVELSVFERQQLDYDYDSMDLWKLWLNVQRDVESSQFVKIEQLLIRPARTEFSEINISRALDVMREALANRGIKGRPFLPKWARAQKQMTFDVQFADDGPTVDILIPTKNNWRVLQRCLTSIRDRTNYKSYNVIVIDNASDDPETKKYLSGLKEKVISIPSPKAGFSYSYINNKAAEAATAELLLFLNDDVEVIAPQWLSQMAGWLQSEGVGSVGARLIFPHNEIQHAGLVNNLLDGVLPAPAFKLLPAEATAYFGLDRTTRNCSAVTAACMLTPRALFKKMKGFNETEFAVAYNDCDYGFRLVRKGYRNVYVPSSELYHFEGASRGRGRGNDKPSEETHFIRKYQSWTDPYFNSNLSQEDMIFSTGSFTHKPAYLTLDPFNVCLCSHNLNREGAPLVLFDIAAGLVKSGKSIFVLSLVDGPLRKDFERLGCRVIVRPDIGIFGARSSESFDFCIGQIEQVLVEIQAGVVLANTVLCHWGIIAATRMKIPSIWLIHESEPPFSHLENLKIDQISYARTSFRQTYANVFVARSTMDLYTPLSPQNCRVIYNGFDAETARQHIAQVDRERERKRLGLREGELLFLTPGTVCERKSQLDLITAINGLPDRVVKNLRFCIVGDRPSPYSTQLKEAISALPRTKRNRVDVVPETPEIWKYYVACDCIAFVSKLESFPRVIQEAMYLGLPIISTNSFGIKEQLRDGSSGLLFNPGDTGALIEKIIEVSKDKSLRESLGQNAKSTEQRFPTVQEMQAAYVRLVEEAFLVGQPRQTSRESPWLEFAESHISLF